MVPLQILRIAIILTLLFSLFPMAVSADDDLSIEFIVKDGVSLYFLWPDLRMTIFRLSLS